MFIKVGRESAHMEIRERRRRLFSGARFASAIFHSSGASFRYFAGCGVDGAYLVLRKGGGIVFTSGMNLRQAREGCCYPVKQLANERSKTLVQIRKACGGKTFRSKAPGGTGANGSWKVGCAPHELTAARYLALRNGAKLRLVDAGEKIGCVRARKGGGELAKIEAAAKITRGILDSLDPWGSKTELQLSVRLKMLALQKGCEVAFEPVVATGRNSAKPHHEPSNARLGDFVLVDFGVKKGGYCSDFTRCYFRRRGMPEEKAYEKCKSVYYELLESLPECRHGKDVAALSEKLLKRHGLPPLIHSIGHGIGLEVHEAPHIGRKSRDPLKGAALAIEPAAYFARFGVRYEGMAAEKKGKWRGL
jgi:Xaa-Pro aminopeptidase